MAEIVWRYAGEMYTFMQAGRQLLNSWIRMTCQKRNLYVYQCEPELLCDPLPGSFIHLEHGYEH